jgi:hypothetical protein
MPYLYETHLHTAESSACGVSLGHEYIKGYKALGYTGIIVTDHFYNGNTAVSRILPWRKWVQGFCLGYEAVAAAGRMEGLDVFLGWEETFDGDDYLVYGLDKEWLLQHPEAARWSRLEQFETVHRYGGCVVQAHPFRQASYIPAIHLSTGCVDAVEAANGGNEQAMDALAARYARKLALPVTAGSDIHNSSQLETGEAFGVYLDEKLSCIGDYARAVRENRIAGIRAPEGRLRGGSAENVRLQVDIRDSRDRSIPAPLADFLA